MLQQLRVRKVIGEGSYATVFECETPTTSEDRIENGEPIAATAAFVDGEETTPNDGSSRASRCAVKRIEMEKNGVPCVIELSILQSFLHPNVMQSIGVQISKRAVSVVLPLAETDLRAKTLRTVTSLRKVKLWMYQVAHALRLLHSLRIVHGDIKAGNIMIMSSNEDIDRVVVADFSLSTCVFGELPKHMVCTCTHRPIEVWNGFSWTFPVDIFSFGCTLYECSFGRNLFPYQGQSVDGGETPEVMAKSLRCLNHFYTQLNRCSEIERDESHASSPSELVTSLSALSVSVGNNSPLSRHRLLFPKYNFTKVMPLSPRSATAATVSGSQGVQKSQPSASTLNFKPVVLHDLLFPLDSDASDEAKSYRQLASLIFRCVDREASNRPTIEDILRDPFFDEVRGIPGLVSDLSRDKREWLRGGIARPASGDVALQQKFDEWRKKFSVLRLPYRALEYSFTLFRLVRDETFTNDVNSMFFKYREMNVSVLEYTCLAVCAKLFSTAEFRFVENSAELARTEMEVCSHTKFRLLPLG